VPYSFPTIVGKIIQRFGITIGPAFTDELQGLTPVTDMDSLALEHRADDSTINIAAGGFAAFYTVPDTERWHVHYFFEDGPGVGAYLQHLELQRKAEGFSGAYIRLPLEDPYDPAADGTHEIFQEVTLFPQDVIGLWASSYIGAGNGVVRMFYEVEQCAS